MFISKHINCTYSDKPASICDTAQINNITLHISKHKTLPLHGCPGAKAGLSICQHRMHQDMTGVCIRHVGMEKIIIHLLNFAHFEVLTSNLLMPSKKSKHLREWIHFQGNHSAVFISAALLRVDSIKKGHLFFQGSKDSFPL